jgi:glycosyltransferase involved in cell wall biosynthesis
MTISVAMCTYNGEKYLKEQLESIAAQSRQPKELVICDDRSTDNSVAVIQEFAARAPFAVHLHINEQNLGSAAKGITRNFEKAVALCTGEIIVPCDQDDIWAREKLDHMAAILEADPGVGAVFSDAQLVNQAGEPKNTLLSQTTGMNAREQAQLESGNGLPVMLSMTKVYGSSLMFRASLREKILPVPQHWWFDAWVSCVAVVYSRLVFTREELFFYRIHPTQSVSASLPDMAQRVQRWRSSAAEYWRVSEPQLMDLYSRLEAEQDRRFDPQLSYLRGRMRLLKFRAEMPVGRLLRWAKILSHARDYFLYFNGWRSLVKDLTA